MESSQFLSIERDKMSFGTGCLESIDEIGNQKLFIHNSPSFCQNEFVVAGKTYSPSETLRSGFDANLSNSLRPIEVAHSFWFGERKHIFSNLYKHILNSITSLKLDRHSIDTKIPENISVKNYGETQLHATHFPIADKKSISVGFVNTVHSVVNDGIISTTDREGSHQQAIVKRKLIGRSKEFYIENGITSNIFPYNFCVPLSESRTNVLQNENVNFTEKLHKTKLGCYFCRARRFSDFLDHQTKNSQGIVVCPFLRKIECSKCGCMGGDNAHTSRYCQAVPVVSINNVE